MNRASSEFAGTQVVVHRVRRPVRIRYAARRLGALRTWGTLADVNRQIDQLVMPLIADRRSGTHHRGATDILSMLVAARTEDGDGLSDNEIRDDVITLMLAGHETTATTLAWLVDLLAHHRHVQERVRSEVGTEMAAYTEAVINETLRLHPPAPITGRMTVGHYRLGDYILEPGTRIVLLLDVINRDPQTYPEPNEFRPERFLGVRPTPYGWVPFGGGLKRCIGASFSLCELTTMLHTMLRCHEIRPYSRHEESPSSRGAPVVVPANGARVYVAPLSGGEKVSA